MASTILFYLCLVSAASGWSSLPFKQPKSHYQRTLQRSKALLHLSSSSGKKRRRSQVDDLISSITSPPTFPNGVDPQNPDNSDDPNSFPADPNDDNLAPLIHTIVHAADMRKASNIVAMRVTKCTSLTNFVVIVSGTSRPQNQAIVAAIGKDVEETFVEDGKGKRCLGKGVPEGSADSGWILLDYGEVMVHVMTPKSRLFYDIEGQWKQRGGEYMDLSDILIDDAPVSSMGNSIDSIGSSGFDDLDESYDDDDEEPKKNKPSLKERLDVEKEIDPFWS